MISIHIEPPTHDGNIYVNRKETYTWTGDYTYTCTNVKIIPIAIILTINLIGVDFLASCGGFLGLFLGMSALSIIELLYYSTLRLFWTFRRIKSESNAKLPKIQMIRETPVDCLY